MEIFLIATTSRLSRPRAANPDAVREGARDRDLRQRAGVVRGHRRDHHERLDRLQRRVTGAQERREPGPGVSYKSHHCESIAARTSNKKKEPRRRRSHSRSRAASRAVTSWRLRRRGSSPRSTLSTPRCVPSRARVVVVVVVVVVVPAPAAASLASNAARNPNQHTRVRVSPLVPPSSR